MIQERWRLSLSECRSLVLGHDPPVARYKLLAFSKAMLTAVEAAAVVHPGLDCDAAYELDHNLLDSIAQAFYEIWTSEAF